MASTSVPSPDEITHAEFTSLLNEYPSLVDTISKLKGSKSGQKTLQQLDEYRYGTAVAEFGTSTTPKEMTLDDVRLLVEWKLRHGKFRPMLMGLASSNNAPLARKTIAAAIQAYRRAAGPSDASSVAAALKELTKLRGIGPATASLLLSVHDPERVIFFSDEAFYWLCGGGKVGSINYNNKEYEMLRGRAGELVKRLGVSATDVEKVAYVLFKRDRADDAGADDKGEAAPKAAKTAKTAKNAKSAKSAKVTEEPGKESKNKGKSAKDTKTAKEASAKRKSTAVQEDEPAPGTRRSKRVKQ
ncbi:hypothetical protein LMH87_006017 [Akanthomyces muscarius]|uniref:Uncharacterized protein n=1 Tax=Akanthomyces muscarius TaxID=2231603 RepID=A0A9W8QN19_AKAMU|nr:hypothetical protein LMH87_006017 [Akanthomyces muscarius]KAJ4164340.1 hypothetical protein LMH87_006017 [Akanthomyces muscarius]